MRVLVDESDDDANAGIKQDKQYSIESCVSCKEARLRGGMQNEFASQVNAEVEYYTQQVKHNVASVD